MCIGPSNGTPNILNLNLKLSITLRHDFIPMNSAEKVLVSTVDCLLLNHAIGTLLTNRINPLCELIYLVAWACPLEWTHEHPYNTQQNLVDL